MKDDQIIFIFDYFYPGFTAGGPITALGNLGQLVREDIALRILTSAYDYVPSSKLLDVKTDSWSQWARFPVWYASDWRGVIQCLKALPKGKSTTLYLNGIFSLQFFLIPLWLARQFDFNVIISPRGMLQGGALRKRRSKKVRYIFLLKISGLLKGVKWHATDEQELIDIKNKITKKSKIIVIPDVPLVSETPNVYLEKMPGKLKLVYFSLIAEKKNLLFILKLVDTWEFSQVQLDIIGPVKDKSYWYKCKFFISNMINPERIHYKGKVAPDKVQGILPNYHAMVLSTHGENFGHVIIEMLAGWRPVLISDKTPWNDLSAYGAGGALPLNMDFWQEGLRKMLKWDQYEFEAASGAARTYYVQKFDFDDLRTRYIKLFSPPDDSEKETIFIYDYFYPDFTAGGPIASLSNLGNLLKGETPLRILTSAYHYKNGNSLSDVEPDQWTTRDGLPVWYARNKQSIVRSLTGLKVGRQTTLYLNGIFSINYFLLPLWLSVIRNNKVIVSPRGMLQSGAMKKGRIKKEIYIQLLRLTGLLKNVIWHATDEQEFKDIKKKISAKSLVRVLSNVPFTQKNKQSIIRKQPGELRLVYYSLISEKKNLIFLLKLLDLPGLENIRLDILGPVKDNNYWKKCKKQISLLRDPDRVVYGGEVKPKNSIDCISKFHALVLPTLAENFGHAIIEMLSASRPVLISDKTPWNDLAVYNAGYSLPLVEKVWVTTLLKMLMWDDNEYTAACTSAFGYYKHKFDFERIKKDYLKLFTIE